MVGCWVGMLKQVQHDGYGKAENVSYDAGMLKQVQHDGYGKAENVSYDVGMLKRVQHDARWRVGVQVWY